MLIDRNLLSAVEIHELTGWELKPEGACRGAECVPLPDLDIDERIDITDFAEAMGMPVASEPGLGAWALGRRASGSVLESAVCPPVVLEDFGGDAFDLASLRGRKVLLVAWASW